MLEPPAGAKNMKSKHPINLFISKIGDMAFSGCQVIHWKAPNLYTLKITIFPPKCNGGGGGAQP